jgi:riboflavin kinase / FMN adenylyltransferase
MTAPPADPAPSIVVPGNLDGVHLGHRALLDGARARAGRDGAGVLALFFDPQPLEVLRPDRAPPRLTQPPRRSALLRMAGADAVAVERFDEGFSRLSAAEFARGVLVERHGARGVVVGPDFRFGHGREGDVERLRTLGAELGFDVTIVEPVRVEGDVVSSSRVRALLAQGDVARAARLLARVHEVEGEVIRGDGRGRTIGFPTANLRCEPVLLPADGVYAVVARDLSAGDDAPLLLGVANLGSRPTFDAGRAVEVHLFDFDADLYGHRLRVGFVHRVRGEQRFEGVQALEAQIGRDVVAARAALQAMHGELVTWV